VKAWALHTAVLLLSTLSPAQAQVVRTPADPVPPPAFQPAPHVPAPGAYAFDAHEHAGQNTALSPGRALANVGARAPGLDLSLVPPPPPANVGARILVMGGVVLVAVGLAGMFASPHCELRAPGGGCRVARGTDAVFPSLLVLGLGATATGAYWMRRDLPVQD
jgi:hypothetical protein